MYQPTIHVTERLRNVTIAQNSQAYLTLSDCLSFLLVQRKGRDGEVGMLIMYYFRKCASNDLPAFSEYQDCRVRDSEHLFCIRRLLNH